MPAFYILVLVFAVIVFADFSRDFEDIGTKIINFFKDETGEEDE